MVRGFYTAGTGMMLQRRNMEVVTNNIVNAETNGFKKDVVVSRSFDDVLIERIRDQTPRSQSAVGPLNFGTRVDMLAIDYSQGNMEPTGNVSDIALVGDAFFVVQTPQGERYTRGSAWTVNANGYLTDGDGNFLLGSQGQVYVGTRAEFSVDNQGNVMVEGNPAGQIRVVRFEDNTQLRKMGHNLFESPVAPQEAVDYEVKQGYLENANVDIGREMVDMITVYRTYETNQRMLTMIDETVGKAVNDIGRLR